MALTGVNGVNPQGEPQKHDTQVKQQATKVSIWDTDKNGSVSEEEIYNHLISDSTIKKAVDFGFEIKNIVYDFTKIETNEIVALADGKIKEYIDNVKNEATSFLQNYFKNNNE